MPRSGRNLAVKIAQAVQILNDYALRILVSEKQEENRQFYHLNGESS